MKYPGYEPGLICAAKAYVHHTVSGQGTAMSTLDHLATTPNANYAFNEAFSLVRLSRKRTKDKKCFTAGLRKSKQTDLRLFTYRLKPQRR